MELTEKIEEHFATITPEGLEKNLVKAGIQVYMDTELNFIEESSQEVFQQKDLDPKFDDLIQKNWKELI